MLNTEKKTASSRFTNFFYGNKTLFILIVLMIVVSFGSKKFLTYHNIMNIVRQITISGILGLGFTFVITSGCIDLSVGRMMGMICVITGLLSKTGVPFIVTVLCAVMLGLTCGFMNSMIVTKLHLNPFIATLATQQVYRGMANILCNNTTIGGIDKGFAAIGQGYWFNVPIPVYILIIMTVIMLVILKMTPFGRRVEATGGNAEAARVSGINTEKIRVMVYMLLGLCVSIAAIVMNGRLDSAQANASGEMEMDIIAAVVLGGTLFSGGGGNIFGTIFGCMVIGVISNGLNLMNVNSNWQFVAKGIIIVVAMILDNKSEEIMRRASRARIK